jgi:hypothetical protein
MTWTFVDDPYREFREAASRAPTTALRENWNLNIYKVQEGKKSM